MKSRGLWINLCLAAGSLIFCLILIECAFKGVAWLTPNQAGPTSIEGLPYDNTPNAKFWRYDKEAGFNYYQHNSFGMRSPEINLHKPAGVYRIALLGDSVAHGGNVTQSQTTASQLEELLNRELSPRKFEVLNFGVAGFGLREYAILIEKKVMAFSPDLVLVGLCLNDYAIPDHKQLSEADKSLRKNFWKERFDNLFKSHLVDFISQVVYSGSNRLVRKAGEAIISSESLQQLERAYGLGENDRQAVIEYCRTHRLSLRIYLAAMADDFHFTSPEVWIRNEGFIQSIIRRCRENKTRVYFFAYPLSMQILPGYTNRDPQQTIRQIVEKNGAEYIEMLDDFRSYAVSHPEKRIYPGFDIMHMYANGHERVAKKIASMIGLS